MAITMQGSWTVSVKAKNAAFAQRFVIAGATSGNGTYAGAVATPPVLVTGAAWSVTVQNNPGTGWVDSGDQIRFPTVSGGQVRFDIETNDAGGDEDFDDLILTCSMPQTATDFVVYGNVRYYAGLCFNPCFRRFVVIDTLAKLTYALQNPVLAKAVQALYPHRVLEEEPRIGAFPPRPPEPPIMIPLDGSGALPSRQAMVLRLSEKTEAAATTKKRRAAAEEEARTVVAMRTIGSQARVQARASLIDTVAIASIIDKLFPICRTGKLAGVVLRFLEYDRTVAELAGGPYSGTGDRETLGVCATDRNGNYIFRFDRTLAEFFGEADVDVAAGENEVVQSMPDLIAQVLDPMAAGGVRYESAPYFNVPILKRIDLCVPDLVVPSACQGQNAIQSIGNIFIGAPVVGPPPPGQPPGFGPRVGFNNFLGSGGRITAKNSLGPSTRCAAWVGSLDLYACFLDHPNVKTYTIRYRPLGTSTWNFFTQEYKHPKIASIGLPGYDGDTIGPITTPLHIDGGPADPSPAYTNIENDVSFVFTHRNRKAQILTGLYAPTPGAVQFRIEGYDAAGNVVAGADDSVTLFIDNVVPRLNILSVEMDDGLGAPQSGGDCALFTVPAGNPAEPLRVVYRADDLAGSLGTYNLSVRKGNIGTVGIAGSGGPISGAYAHIDDLLCTDFHGTSDDPGADSSAFITTEVSPSSGAWLDPGQPFCTFAVNVGATTRVTDGYSTGDNHGPTQYLLGIQQ